jgi:prepilin-type processing-associated H-X9-DG protein
MKTVQFRRREILASVVLILALVSLPMAGAQEVPHESLQTNAIEGTWYGWIMGNGMQVKITRYPGELKALMRVTGRGAHAMDEIGLTPSVRGEYLYLEGAEWIGAFQIEGRLLHGTLTRDNESITVTLARSMPDVESLFDERIPDARRTVSMPAQIRGASQNNLKQLGLVMKMFANESRGQIFPRLDPRPGHLMMLGNEVFPEYVTDVSVYISPAHPQAADFKERATQDPLSIIDDHSYWYLGYAIPNEEAGLAFVEAYKKAVKNGEGPGEDLKDTATSTIMRLREGVERFFITDINDPASSARIQSEIPIMIERPGLQEGGSNVLYMDGHVVFIKYPGIFPMTEKFIQALESLDALKK